MSQNESESEGESEGISGVELGQATIVYEDPEEGTREETVQNEQLVYAQDHWAYMSGQDEQGNDLVRRIPRDRVHYVERNVQQFEEEVKTVRHRVESIADEVRQKLPMKVGDGQRGRGRQGNARPAGQTAETRTRSETIPVEEGSDSEENR